LMMTIHKIRRNGKASLMGESKRLKSIEKKRQKGKVKK
jgi:hypothetical protein